MTMRFAKPVLADGDADGRVRLRYVPSTQSRGWWLVLVAFLSPLLYLILRLAYSPAIEAPGYIVPGTPELHVAAYVPPNQLEYARTGQQATVVFPDGERLNARITDVAQAAAREVPLSDGHTALGVLVRMDFVEPETAAGAREAQSGLPVKIRFPKRWP